MANLPESLFGEAPSLGAAASPSTSGPDSSTLGVSLEHLILALHNDHTREKALRLLSENKGIREDLAPLLWHSFGTISTLLKEIIAVYPKLSSPELTESRSLRVCNALALLQCVAVHPDTRMLFIKANIPLYVYPFLNTKNNERPCEYLRLTSLGVIGALVKTDDAEVIHFLLKAQIFPYCLRCMEVGNVLIKTVATFIVQKILMQDEGMKYCCGLADRFFAIGRALGNMVEKLAEEPPQRLQELPQQLLEPPQRLLKLIIRCYLRLSECPRARHGLRCCLPMKLRDAVFINLLHDDPTALGLLQQLYYNVSTAHQSTTQPDEELLKHLVRG